MSYNNNLKDAYPLTADMLPNSWLLTLESKFSICKAITSLVSKVYHILADRLLEMVLWVVQYNSRVWQLICFSSLFYLKLIVRKTFVDLTK